MSELIESVDEVMSPSRQSEWMLPMGDGPYPRGIWETWQAGMEPMAGGITLGTNDHTEMFCRVSGYLRNASDNARRMCALWNAFIGVPTAEIERLAFERSGWKAPDHKAMWQNDSGAMKNAEPSCLNKFLQSKP